MTKHHYILGGIITAIVLFIGSCIYMVEKYNWNSEHFACWDINDQYIREDIEARIEFPATLKFVDAPLSLTSPPDEGLAEFGIHFEHLNSHGIPIRGRAIVTYKPESTESDGRWCRHKG